MRTRSRRTSNAACSPSNCRKPRPQNRGRLPSRPNKRRSWTMSENNTALVNTHANEITQTQPISSGLTFVPRVDVFETGEELVLIYDLPGVKPADLDLNFE